MCCFSQPVKEVTATKIFARTSKTEQFLAYQMKLSSSRDVAMVLPLPIKQDRQSKIKQPRLEFINLSDYSSFFADLERCFPQKPRRSRATVASAIADTGVLKVHSVGSFDASYVPTIKDFQRLDPQFRLPDNIWEKLPQYQSYGFAVFKLKQGDFKVHPMALRFLTQDNQVTFFPTLHIHDRTLESYAEFDHTLYLQCDRQIDFSWTQATIPVDRVIDTNNPIKGDRTKGIMAIATPLYKKVLKGLHPNQDLSLVC